MLAEKVWADFQGEGDERAVMVFLCGLAQTLLDNGGQALAIAADLAVQGAEGDTGDERYEHAMNALKESVSGWEEKPSALAIDGAIHAALANRRAMLASR